MKATYSLETDYTLSRLEDGRYAVAETFGQYPTIEWVVPNRVIAAALIVERQHMLDQIISEYLAESSSQAVAQVGGVMNDNREG